MNLTEELDRSFGSGPEHRPIEDRLAAGRRLVRRRRTAAIAATVAVVAVVGTAGAFLGGGDRPSSDGGVATQPSGDPDASREQPGGDENFRLEPGQQIGLDRDGTLHAREGVDVVRTVDNPMDYAAPDHSIGVVYTFEGTTYWALATYELGGNSGGAFSATDEAERSFPTFDYWLDDQVALQQGDETLSLVTFGQGETLRPREGVEILRQTGEIDLPANFARPGDRTAVAEVTYRGERWYVLARQLDGSEPEYFPSAAAVTRPSLEAFLDYAADAYAAEEGLR